MACTVATWAAERGRLAGSFFSSRGSEDLRDFSAIIPTIAYQLAQYHQSYKRIILEGLRSDFDIRDREASIQSKILLKPLAQAVLEPQGLPLLIVVDALDECHEFNGCEGGDAIPELIMKLQKLPYTIKILISGQPEKSLTRMFDQINTRAPVIACRIEEFTVPKDMRMYYDDQLTQLGENQALHEDFLSDVSRDAVIERAGPLFVYVSLVIRCISDYNGNHRLHLRRLLDTGPDELLTSEPRQRLSILYIHILEASSQMDDSHPCDPLGILGLIVCLQDPLSVAALAELTKHEADRIWAFIRHLSVILTADADAPIRLLHTSFVDFIMDPARCSDPRFLVSSGIVHQELATRSLAMLNQYYSENAELFSLNDSSCQLENLENQFEKSLPSHVRYACLFWHAHLCLSGAITTEQWILIQTFTTSHGADWLKTIYMLKGLGKLYHKLPILVTLLRNYSRTSTDANPGDTTFRPRHLQSVYEDMHQAISHYFWSTRISGAPFAVSSSAVQALFGFAKNASIVNAAVTNEFKLKLPSRRQGKT